MLNNVEKAILFVSTCDFIGAKKQYKIVTETNLENLIENFSEFKQSLMGVLSQKEIEQMENVFNLTNLNSYISNLEKSNIKVVTIKSKTYPKLLKEITNPPIVLYAKGNVELLNSTCVAIVGSRRASRYGKDVTEQFSKAIAESGVTIVSGLADGVDTFAHTACLNAKGKTIAVLGSGINEIYPATNTNLANKIVECDGLLISEHKPNEKPQTYYFPIRNRIIAGLCKAVVITEATEKSGSMHTKNYALDFGREVFAVPGRITDIYSVGCNKIIKNCQSAIALGPSDVLNFLGKNFVENKPNVVQYSLTDKIILDIIDVNEVHYEEILQKSGMDSKELNTALIRLELKKLIKKLPGNFYSK